MEQLSNENYQKFKDLSVFPHEQIIKLFLSIPKAKTLRYLRDFNNDFLENLLESAPSHLNAQWRKALEAEPDTVGELMQAAPLILNENLTIEDAISEIKKIPKEIIFTYGMVIDDNDKLTGVLVFRDIFYHKNAELLKNICFKDPICFNPNEEVIDVFVKVAGKQIPEYPVTDNENKLLGMIRGSHIADAHALEVIAQSGILVGVSKEEALDSSWSQCIKLRGPWLLLNLVTAFVAGAVVGIFQETIDKLVLLAMFLPVLAGQSGNTGAQALAVLIRELTGSSIGNKIKGQLIKETVLGIVHGLGVGLICAVVMYYIASSQNSPHAFPLSIIILFAMAVSCIISGLMGAIVPITLKKFGADPAAGSSIILTTGTDVVSMGVMLFLAQKFIVS